VRRAIETLERTIGVTGSASRVLREIEDTEREFWPFGDGTDFDSEKAARAGAIPPAPEPALAD
jgi:hypothetical protein